MRRLPIIMFFLGAHLQGFGQQITGKELLEACEVRQSEPDGFCEGFVSGTVGTALSSRAAVSLAYLSGAISSCPEIADLTEMTGQGNQYAAEMFFCLPEGTSRAQLVNCVLKWLQNNPVELYKEASRLVVTALREVFPCS